MVPASAGAATFTDDSTADFTNGTPGADTWAVDESVRPRPDRVAHRLRHPSRGVDRDPHGREHHDGRRHPDRRRRAGRLQHDAHPRPVPGVPGLVRHRRLPERRLRRGHQQRALGVRQHGPSGGNPSARTFGAGGDTLDSLGLDAAGPHVYRIAWTDTGVKYSVDGAEIVTQQGIPQSMEIAASDFTPGGSAITLDWMALVPYATAGAFESQIRRRRHARDLGLADEDRIRHRDRDRHALEHRRHGVLGLGAGRRRRRDRQPARPLDPVPRPPYGHGGAARRASTRSRSASTSTRWRRR